ncbi:MAG: hypothetical protein AAFQ43_13460 [Bacteroidota bacterium]
MPRFRLPFIVLTPLAISAGAAVGLWLHRRWGFGVRETEADVARVEGPPEASGPGLQTAEEGVGPRFHRRYRVRVARPTLSPEALVAAIGADMDAFVASEVARFEKTAGEPHALAPGDEFLVHIRAPWDGPVRVVEVEPTRFVLATREGHMEAGQIEFRAEPAPPSSSGADASSAPESSGGAASDDLVFTIESWARSRDAFIDFVYGDLGIAKDVQQGMWTFFCEAVAERLEGRVVGEIEVHTEREAT